MANVNTLPWVHKRIPGHRTPKRVERPILANDPEFPRTSFEKFADRIVVEGDCNDTESI